MITHTIGAILAGGASERMGKDKSALIVDGLPFLERIHQTMSEVFTEVIVCGGSIVPENGVLIPDERPGEGPVVGLLSAFHIARGRAVFVTAVDTPLVTAEVMRLIADPPVPETGIRIAVSAGRVQPLVGVYGSGVAPVARARFEAGQRSVLGVVEDIERVVQVEVDPETLFNVNTEEDYERLIGRYGL